MEQKGTWNMAIVQDCCEEQLQIQRRAGGIPEEGRQPQPPSGKHAIVCIFWT